MAKPGTSSCRPLVQGMMLLALLLLASIASIQAGVLPGELIDAAEKLGDQFFKEVGKKPGLEDFGKGGRTGLKVHKKLCRAQGWMDKQNPGGSGTPPWVPCPSDEPQVPAAGTTLVPSRYPTNDVRITGTRVGQQEEVPMQVPAYLSNAQP